MVALTLTAAACASGVGPDEPPPRGPRSVGEPEDERDVDGGARAPSSIRDAGTDAPPMRDALVLLLDCTGAEDETPCIDPSTATLGRCAGDLCCTGCLTGELVCHRGAEPTACGASGGWCDVCVTGLPCEDGLCGSTGP